MNQANEKLPDDLVWQPDGHASEIALTALADGQDAILPDACAGHVGACDACTARLGHLALASFETGEALRLLEPAALETPATALAVAPKAALIAASDAALAVAHALTLEPLAPETSKPATPRRLAPAASIWAAFAALAVALLGLLPGLPGTLASARSAALLFPRAVGLAAHALVSLQRGTGLSLAAALVSAGFLIATGLLVARVMPRGSQLEGGVR